MGFDKKYRVSPEAVLSYSFDNIVDGTGTIIFYGMTQYLNGSTIHTLSTNVIPSMDIYDQRTSVGTNTLTFNSIAFNAQRVINGVPVLSVMQYAADICAVQVTAQLYKVDSDGNATAISDEESGPVTNDTSGGVDGRTVVLQIPLTSDEVVFNKGDKLRMVLKHIQTIGGSTRIFHDPSDRNAPTVETGTGGTSVMQLLVSTKIFN